MLSMLSPHTGNMALTPKGEFLTPLAAAGRTRADREDAAGGETRWGREGLWGVGHLRSSAAAARSVRPSRGRVLSLSADVPLNVLNKSDDRMHL